jgi:hypothetical protein
MSLLARNLSKPCPSRNRNRVETGTESKPSRNRSRVERGVESKSEPKPKPDRNRKRVQTGSGYS